MSIGEIKEILQSLNYKRVLKVSSLNEYSHRGGIVDINSSRYKNPIRLDFFDDCIESIREFDIKTQRSINEIKSFTFTRLPGNNSFELVTVQIPPPVASNFVIEAIPTLKEVDGITFAAKVLIPTNPLVVPNNDLISETECSVIANATLPLLTPSKIRDSF